MKQLVRSLSVVIASVIGACEGTHDAQVSTHTNSDDGRGSKDSGADDAAAPRSTDGASRGTDEPAGSTAGEATDPTRGALTEPPWWSSCGNGALDPGEACDDGSTLDGDGCTRECCLEQTLVPQCSAGWTQLHTAPCHCGDGFMAADEECDDGNLEFGDGCNGYCQLQSDACGDGVMADDEECDDRNAAPYDGCDRGCHLEQMCASIAPAGTPDGGSSAVCGNLIIERGETCDDGNTEAEDRCDPVCLLECGNGQREGDEECDDGNLERRDGCDEHCRAEVQLAD